MCGIVSKSERDDPMNSLDEIINGSKDPHEVKRALRVNGDKDEKAWSILCIPFAPNAPDQNPVEDIWLQGKNYLRKCFAQNKAVVASRNVSFDSWINSC